MRNFRRCLSTICVLAIVGWAPRVMADESIDQKIGQPLSMEKYGGLNKELVVLDVDQDAIRFAVVDYTRMIWRSQSYGQNQRYGVNGNNPVQVPTVSELRRNRHERPDQGSSRIGGLYLLYEEPSTGLKIYYKDTLATPSDAVRLKIIPGHVSRH